MKIKIKGLYLKHGKYYWQPPTADGVRPKPVALRTEDFAVAIKKVEELKREERVNVTREPLAALITAYLRAKSAAGEHGSDQTTETARPALRRLDKFAKRPAAQITREDIEQFKSYLLTDQELSAATVTGYLRYCQSFFSWLVREGRLIESPFKGVKFPKSVPTKRGSACTRNERDRLIAFCTNPDLKAVLFFGFHTGMRRNEILNMRPHWIVYENKRPAFIHIQNEPAADGIPAFKIKDKTAKIVPISRRLAKFMIFEYRVKPGARFVIAPHRLPGKYKYRWEFKRTFKTHAKRCGLEWVSPHTMRHTFVSLLASAPADRRPGIEHIARWTGTEPETLRKTYQHFFDDQKHIDAAE